jgi:hypothetical protein
VGQATDGRVVHAGGGEGGQEAVDQVGVRQRRPAARLGRPRFETAAAFGLIPT